MINYIKKHKIFILFLTFIFLYEFIFDIFQEKTLRTFLGSRIYVLFQELSPEEARKMVIDDAGKNPELKEFHNIMHQKNNGIWTRMYVCDDEYFFPLRWPQTDMEEEGYYVNPKTKKIRYVNTDFSFRFPLLFDMTALSVNNKRSWYNFLYI